MNMLITIKELKKLKSRDKLPCECKFCKTTFYITKNYAQRAIKGTKKSDFCSRNCARKFYKKQRKKVECAYCQISFEKPQWVIERNEKIGIKNTFCSVKCSCKFYSEKRISNKKRYYCPSCNKEIGKNSKICHTCRIQLIRSEYIKRWLQGLEFGYSGKTIVISKIIRDYLINKYNNKCSKCGWDKVNVITKKVPLEINHIDGNAKNCTEENLEVVCPNCHSLTPNFRNLNKKSCRIRK